MAAWRAELALASRYLSVGVINTAVGFACIALLTWLGFNAFASNLAGYTIGLLTGYVLSRTYVFKPQRKSRSEPLLYAACFCVSYGLNLLALYAVLSLHAPALVAQLAGMTTYTLSMYALSRWVVFRN